MGQLEVRCPFEQLSVASVSVSVSCGKLNTDNLASSLDYDTP
jgi:hypothetical protein